MKWILYAQVVLLTGSLHSQVVPADATRPQAVVTGVDTPLVWERAFSDPRWQQATPVSLCPPSNITFPKPPEGTQVRMLWQKDFLFIRFDCQDKSIVYLPESQGKASPPRDLLYFKADAVEVFLDPFGDSRMYMEFQFSPNNGVYDGIYFLTAPPKSQPSYFLDADVASRDIFSIKEWNLEGLKTATRVWPASEGHGWSVIAAFPADQILYRYGQKEYTPGLQMRINLVRFDYAKGEKTQDITNWSPVLGGCAHYSPTGMGTIQFGPITPAQK